jgi:hypothetical protein
MKLERTRRASVLAASLGCPWIYILVGAGCGTNQAATEPLISDSGIAQHDADADASSTADADAVATQLEDGTIPESDSGCSQSCPSSPPEAGSPCSGPQGFSCEYGSDPRTLCNTTASCRTGTGWAVQLPSVGPTPICPTTVASPCPPSFVAGPDSGLACAGNKFECYYAQGNCVCDPSFGPSLTCAPTPVVGCPQVRPLYGTPCDGSCSSWGVCGGLGIVTPEVCTCGTWQPAPCIPQ